MIKRGTEYPPAVYRAIRETVKENKVEAARLASFTFWSYLSRYTDLDDFPKHYYIDKAAKAAEVAVRSRYPKKVRHMT